MDIPQHPKPIAVTPNPQPKPTQSENHPTTPVSIEALNLEKNKVYQAIVSKLVASAKMPHSSNAETSPPLNNTEWLLKLNGKLLLTSSEKPLQLGQKLSVILNSDSSLTVLPTRPLNPNPLNTDKTLTNNTTISLLLNAINQAMPRQVSLNTGLEALDILSKQSNSTQASNQAKVVLSMLAKQAPNQHFFSEINKVNPSSTNNTPTSTAKDIFRESGIFFESLIKQSPGTPSSIKHQITQLQHTLSTTQTNTKTLSNTLQKQINDNTIPQQKEQASPSGTLNTTRTTPQTLQTSQQPQTPQQHSLNQSTNNSNLSSPIPATAAAKVPAHASTSASAPTSTSPIPASVSAPVGTTTPLTIGSSSNSSISNDLKGLLLAVTSALKTGLPNTNQTKPSYVEALAQLDLLNSPFNFPHFSGSSSVQNTSKAESLLAEQQFTTGQLLKLIAGMLNRIQFNQLNSLYQSQSNTSETSNIQSWFFELPVTNPHNQFTTFDVRIDQEEDTSKEEQESLDTKIQWRLALSFNFEQLGAIYVQAILNPPTITSTIWADRPETLDLINREKSHFQSKLTELGLEVSDICCQKGHPKQNKTRLDRSLVDIKA